MKFGLEAPQVVGVEIHDEATGDWSFLLIAYGFVWRFLHTWAGHFANARQMAALIKALSHCKKLRHPHFTELCINNTPAAFANAYGLTHSEAYRVSGFLPYVRLPDTVEHPHNSQNQVHWLGLSNFFSTTRA